jgi:hypothetical protein
MRCGQNVTVMGWPKLQWVKMSQCDKPSTFGVDEQSVHFESEGHRRKLSQSQNVTVEKCHMVKCHSRKLSQWTKYFVDVPCGSECCVVGLWVDIMSRHRTVLILMLEHVCLHIYILVKVHHKRYSVLVTMI